MTKELEKEVDKETPTCLKKTDSQNKNYLERQEDYFAPKLDALTSLNYYGVIV